MKIPLPKCGILGSGQLGRMLVEAAQRLGLKPRVWAIAIDDPAAKLARDVAFESGAFFQGLDCAVFENEFVDCDRLTSQAGPGIFRPGLEAIRALQDKLGQKEVLARLGIPSARYGVYGGAGDRASLGSWCADQLAKNGGTAVFKWARLGYDGKGTFLARAATSELAEFCAQALVKGVRVFCEECVDFETELSLVSVFSTKSEFKSYGLVKVESVRGICDLVQGPGALVGVSAGLEKEARSYARALAEEMKLYGTFAIEFFLTREGRLVVNEIAPRVHNTGHFTLDAAATSQFENHWRAVLGMDLGDTSTSAAFAMVNLLGPSGVAPQVAQEPPPFAKGIFLHWYDKMELRAGRKMGHLNAASDSARDLGRLVLELRKAEKQWLKQVLE